MARITARGMWLSAALLATVGAGQARADPEARSCLVTCMGAGSSPSCVPQVAFNGFICAMSLCDTVCASQGGCAEGIFNSELCPPGQVAAGCDASCLPLCGTPTPSSTPTSTPTDTPTHTPTSTPTNTPTATPTFTPTHTPTNTPTATPTNTPVPIGGACSTPAQCATPGFCVDNVCCNAPCTGPLQRCNLPDELGSCVSAAAPAPALTPWGLLATALLLVSAGVFTLRRRMRGR